MWYRTYDIWPEEVKLHINKIVYLILNAIMLIDPRYAGVRAAPSCCHETEYVMVTTILVPTVFYDYYLLCISHYPIC